MSPNTTKQSFLASYIAKWDDFINPPYIFRSSLAIFTTVRLIIYADYVRLRSNCKSLQFMLPKAPNHQLSQVPWLMIPNVSETCCRFFSILENKKYNLEIPELRGKLLRGCSYGWILMVNGSPELTLINPLTRAQIQLPPIDTFPDIRLLSSSPTSNEDMAMAIFGEFAELAFYKNGDKKWNLIQREGRHRELDIISHEGTFYEHGLVTNDPAEDDTACTIPYKEFTSRFPFGENDIW
ncbi:f-box/kelch-repeat protein [Quercus suber]|uniref:F-box/kelch-repeat protein n=1 Tax=Quercus suber TaxID=58331 RepID=A0AAW0K5F9_QUESU